MTGLPFDAYMVAVDDYLDRMCGLGSLDLPDYDYWQAWDNGDSPKRCAINSLRNSLTY